MNIIEELGRIIYQKADFNTAMEKDSGMSSRFISSIAPMISTGVGTILDFCARKQRLS